MELSPKSVYEQTFGTVRRGRGRPVGAVEVFRAEGVDPEIVKAAKTRAYAVVHEENKDRLAEVFSVELDVLGSRGPNE